MKGVAFALLLLLLPASAVANSTRMSPTELAEALNSAGTASVPYLRSKGISPIEIRHVRCVGPDEEPTEFQCSWRQSTRNRWVTRKTWLAIDGRGWHVID